jgi:hypothetical protein
MKAARLAMIGRYSWCLHTTEKKGLRQNKALRSCTRDPGGNLPPEVHNQLGVGGQTHRVSAAAWHFGHADSQAGPRGFSLP